MPSFGEMSNMFESTRNIKRVDLCYRINERVKTKSNTPGTGNSAEKMISKKLSKYNQKLVNNDADEEEIILKKLQHEGLYKMMKVNAISRERNLFEVFITIQSIV